MIRQPAPAVLVSRSIPTLFHKRPKLRNSHRVASHVIAGQSDFMLRHFVIGCPWIAFFVAPHQKWSCRNFHKAQKRLVGQEPSIGTETGVTETGQGVTSSSALDGTQTTVT